MQQGVHNVGINLVQIGNRSLLVHLPEHPFKASFYILFCDCRYAALFLAIILPVTLPHDLPVEVVAVPDLGAVNFPAFTAVDFA